MNLLGLLVNLVLIISSVICAEEDTSQLMNIKHLKDKSFDSFIKRASLTAVYFMLKGPERIELFLKEYDRAAELLQNYNVELAVVNCNTEDVKPYCLKKNVDHDVYAFRAGEVMLELSLENMFDVNSILSNVLQLVLLKEVPIVQSKLELNQLLERYRGQKDVFFSFQDAIGTYEHRVFMEVAYAFQSVYKFAITTESSIMEELEEKHKEYQSKHEPQIWLFKCKHVKESENCIEIKYQDNIDLVSLAEFAKVLTIPLIHDVSSDGDYNPFVEHNMHIVTIYYDTHSSDAAISISQKLHRRFSAAIGILLVNVEKSNSMKYGHLKQLQIPRLTVIPRNMEPVLLESTLTEASAIEFITTELGFKSGLRNVKEHKDLKEDDLDAHVEVQDDQVAEAVYRMRHTPFDRQYIPTLTDTTFYTKTKEDLIWVLFYLTFDAKGMAFMRSYVEASKILAQKKLEPLTAIDCFDWTEVCEKNNITSYPTIRVYKKGKKPITYSGMLDTNAIVKAAKMFLVDELTYLSSENDLSSFKSGTYFSEYNIDPDIVILGLFDNDHKKELDMFASSAAELHGKLLLGYTNPANSKIESLRQNCNLPCIVVLKLFDNLQPVTIIQSLTSTESILKSISESINGLFPELSVNSFPALFAMKKPMTILFDENIKRGSGVHKIMEEIINKKEFDFTLFCWMDLTNGEGIAGKILLEYNSGAEPPSVAHVNHDKGEVYNYVLSDLTSKGLISWLSAIRQRTIPPSKLLKEGEWKPLNPGYDFLKMMDEEDEEDVQNSENSRDDDFLREQNTREELFEIRKSFKAKSSTTHQHSEL